jgi:hypothetical protein
MRHEGSKILYSYWNSLRRGRPAPDRAEIEPVEIRAILGDSFILEVNEKMRAVSFRLAGTRLCAAHGRELKGLGFFALWREEDNFDVARIVTRVCRQFQPAIVSYAGHAGEGYVSEFEMLLLPLAPAGDGNPRILGVATPRRQLYWLGARAIEINHLRHIRFPNVRDEAAAPAMSTPEPVASDAKPARNARRVHHLTVHQGGRSNASAE